MIRWRDRTALPLTLDLLVNRKVISLAKAMSLLRANIYQMQLDKAEMDSLNRAGLL